jgi:hypothetical protein
MQNFTGLMEIAIVAKKSSFCRGMSVFYMPYVFKMQQQLPSFVYKYGKHQILEKVSKIQYISRKVSFCILKSKLKKSQLLDRNQGEARILFF